MRLQRTIKREAAFQGIGLHTGKFARVRLRPAPRDTGIVFFRTDRGVTIRADVGSVVDTAFATTIGADGVKVRTIEHLMAAAAGLGIDNLIVEIDGPEVPILDGSATELAGILLDAGIAKQGKDKPFLRITHPVSYEDAHARVVAFPYDGRRISYSISHRHHVVGFQELTLEITEEAFVRDIAPARTFGFLREIEMLRANGLARGGSLDNAIVIGDDGVLNDSGLRFNDEFVRHKILDSVGDLSLLGLPILGHIVFEKAGHTANANFLKKLIASPDCYEIWRDQKSELPVAVNFG
ncbi:MAG: UDP-3-O-acyl-N-acetylglucosamine deacetylase [Nitrospirales bacterium]|nr:UDP-3-O-acyl-N-acetylglucosamine deacetylase [Nitrospirales bacterium]